MKISAYTVTKNYTHSFLLTAESGELGMDVEVEDMELEEPILVVVLNEEAGEEAVCEEADSVLGDCCGPLFTVESSSCLVYKCTIRNSHTVLLLKIRHKNKNYAQASPNL